jgi:hypothetical protein
MSPDRPSQLFIFGWQRFTLVTVGVILLMGGCSMPTPVGDVPACLPEELTGSLDLLNPDNDEVIDTLSPMFVWDWGSECEPEQFLLEVFEPTSVLPAVYSARIPGDLRGQVMRSDLQPGTSYTWRVTPITTGIMGPVSNTFTFLTGPICMDESPVDYPAPVLLDPPDNTVIREIGSIHSSDGSDFPSISLHLVWDDPSLCLPSGYQVQVSNSPVFPTSQTLEFPPHPDDIQTYMLFFFPPGASLTLQDCTRYYWRVRPALADGEYGSYSETWSFLINTDSLLCMTRPLVSPVPPVARGLQNTNCRFGPSTTYSIESTLFEGQSAPIRGRNEDSTWWLIEDPLLTEGCWVWGDAVEVIGDISQVLVVQPRPTPNLNKPTQERKLEGCWIFNPQTQTWYCAPRICGQNDPKDSLPCDP